MKQPILFSPLRLRNLTLRNRIAMPPMCQYSAVDGMANDWHLAHYGSRAALGIGLIVVEATAAEARGRITPHDLGLWKDEQVEPLRKVVDFSKAGGAAMGVQIAHAGRKASCARPWDGGAQIARDGGGWECVAPSAFPFKEGERSPRALSKNELGDIVASFAAAARRALAAGFDLIEIHGAHGYLLHQFLSPLSNSRDDEYGGSFANRARLLLEVVDAVRKVMPEGMPLLVRLSAKDWAEGGWDLPECGALCGILKDRGVDLVDVSSGGLSASQKLVLGPGYQVPFAAAIRSGAGVATGAVGLITEPEQAEAILSAGKADLVFLGRELLRNPGWPTRALRELEAQSFDGSEFVGGGMAPQYLRSVREWTR
ncbi:MAG TPA: NADH:flavin oxidoreductase/NADH oxidase [Rectinemataceae bacterium]|nr:NADH:flavin oxidoreductase/NADH oxidase [Rectinemataceae bacterium]